MLEQELRTIYEAQKIDTRIIGFQKTVEHAPQQIEAMKNELFDLAEKLSRQKEIADELEKERRKKEKDLDVDKEKIKKLEAKLYDVKTNKEYQALLKEIETIKNENDRTEEDVIMLMEKVEELHRDSETTSVDLEKRQVEIEKEIAGLEKEIASIGKNISKLTKERNNLLAVVNESLRTAYEMLREKRAGVAVVNVKDGVCLGCYMNIPPQFFIEVTRNSQVNRCPSCSRIFYFADED